MRPAAATLLVLTLSLAFGPISAGRRACAAEDDGGVTVADRRAALALFNAITPNDARRPLDRVTPEQVRRLDVYRPNGTGGGREFAIRYGVPATDSSGRGSYKIVLGASSDFSKGDWKRESRIESLPAEAWTRLIDRSERERYMEYCLRGQYGSVELSITERCPKGEATFKAHERVSERYLNLVKAAKEAGLVCSVRAAFVPGGGRDDVDLATNTPRLTLPAEGRSIRLRFEFLDGDGKPVEPLAWTIELGAHLSAHSEVVGAKRHGVGMGRYEVVPQGSFTSVEIKLPRHTPTLIEEIDDALQRKRDAATLTVRIGARQKGATRTDAADAEALPDAQLDATFQVMPWTAYVAALFVAPPKTRDATAYEIAGPDGQMAPGWRLVAPQARTRRAGEAIDFRERVISGLRLTIEKEGADASFVAHYSAAESKPLMLRVGDEARVYAAVGATASIRRHKLQDLVRERFKVLEETLSVVQVSGDPAALREGSPAKDAIPLVGPAASAITFGPASPRVVWSAVHPGVFEFRLRALVAGTLSDADTSSEQTLEAAVRVVVGEAPTTFAWRPLR